MTTTQERAAATPDEDRWCSTCAGTGVTDCHLSVDDHEPSDCRDCDGAGWFNTAGEPADPPRPPQIWRELAGVIAFFAILALAGWLVDNCWPAAVALSVVLIVVAWKWKARSWIR